MTSLPRCEPRRPLGLRRGAVAVPGLVGLFTDPGHGVPIEPPVRFWIAQALSAGEPVYLG